MVVRYVGSAPAEIMDTPFRFAAWGQRSNIPDDLYQHAVDGGLMLLTDQEFNSLGHPAENLTKYQRFETHRDAPETFKSLQRQAWGICQNRNIQAPAPVNPVVVEEDVDA